MSMYETDKNRNWSILISISIIIIMVLLAVPQEVFAGSCSATVKNNFTNDWSKTKTQSHDGGGCARITYWYDTFAINEDGVDAYSNRYTHKPRIKNGNGTFDGKTEVVGHYQALEIRHKGNTVTYSCIYW